MWVGSQFHSSSPEHRAMLVRVFLRLAAKVIEHDEQDRQEAEDEESDRNLIE